MDLRARFSVGPTGPASYLLLAAYCTVWVALAYLLPPIAPDSSYHQFADARTFFSIPRFFDVASNIGFSLVGLVGIGYTLRFALQRKPVPNIGTATVQDALRTGGIFIPFGIFFLALFLTGIGSAYYHLAPDELRLYWDRAPMCLAFASLLTLTLWHVFTSPMRVLLFVFYVVYSYIALEHWQQNGNLTPYVLLQFGGLLQILFLRITSSKLIDLSWFYLLFFYALAKVFETLDHATYEATRQFISGHTLKHLLAAVGSGTILLGYLRFMRTHRTS